jgi:hypothetical protein
MLNVQDIEITGKWMMLAENIDRYVSIDLQKQKNNK